MIMRRRFSGPPVKQTVSSFVSLGDVPTIAARFVPCIKDVPFSVYTDEAVDRQIAMAAHYAGDEVRRIFLLTEMPLSFRRKSSLLFWPACTGPFPISSASQATRGQRISSARAMRSCCVSEKLDSRCFILALKQGTRSSCRQIQRGNRRRIHRGRAESRTKRHEAVHDGHCWSRRRGGVCTSCP